MYSPFYYYFFLRSDQDLSEKRPVKEVKKILSGFNEIIEKDFITYKNQEYFPWIQISLLDANSYNNWSSNNFIKEVNLISITGSKRIDKKGESVQSRILQYIELLKRIADLLNWEVIDEETEDGVEDFLVYKPTIK